GNEDILFELKNSTNTMPPYIHSLSQHIKEIGDVNNYQVFASIMSKSNKNLFSAHIDYVNKDKNTPVIVVHNIKREISSFTTTCLIKLGWIIVGPLTNFDFNVQFPLAFKSMKQSVKHISEENHSTVKITNYKTCILGICALEADSQSSSIGNIDFTRKENFPLSSVSTTESIGIIQYDLKYDPKKMDIVIGTHFSTYKESACLFVYNLIDKPVDETVLRNLSLYTCVVDVDTDERFNFGQKRVKWEHSEQEEISFTEIEPSILSNDDLILISQLFNDCPNCKRGFVNVNSNTGQVIYKSLNSELLDSVENIAYLLIPQESHDKSTECGNKDRASFSSFPSTINASFTSTMDSSFSQIMDDEIGITIIKSDSENNRTEFYTFFPRKETLNFIRTKLEEYDEFYMGTNCHFIKNKAPISRKDESKLNFMQIIETHDNGNNFLYIKEKAEFDKLRLKNEKGFKFDINGSIESASDKAFKIDINKIEFSDPGFVREEKEHKCNHAPNANCKRNLIIDEKFSVALEWVCNSLKLSWKNSKHSNIHLCEWRPKKEIIISDISATNEFIRDVKAALNNNEDIIKHLSYVSEKYGHFYAHHLVLGGARVKNKSHVVNSGEYGLKLSSMFRFGFGTNANVENAQSFHGDNYTSIIGGNKAKYFQDGMKSWDESLKDASTWKIIGYDKIYSLFDLLNEDLQKEVLNAFRPSTGTEDIPFKLKNSMNAISPPYIHNLSPHIKEIGNVNNYQVFASIMSKSNKNLFSAHIDYVNKDKNTPVIVVHNIKRENSNSTICLVKLGWIIVGPLTNFDFNIQFPLVFKSMKQSVKHMASIKENHSTVKINNYKTCILGICALEADSQSNSTGNNDFTRKENYRLSSASSVDITESTETVPYDLEYDPKKIEIVLGTHFSTYKESACLFVYNLKDIDKPIDEPVLQNIALYTW
ncbi:15937_t:CDS:2, partial [Dentiscutata heterogama]